MSIKWTGCESGILRKSENKDKKEDLFVFGYSCKLFRDDDKALHIDQGKHLIPWMGDETLKIDRYDARGALHDLSRLEAPPGGYDWRVELTKDQQDVEQLCDEERYRALHTDEDEEEMYKEEELKRLHAAGYGQVGFNYDTPAEPTPTTQPTEVDEPFVPVPAFKALLPADTIFPETQKQNAIIEKTANFIASQGAQMEILIKAKQGDNPQFQFLGRDSNLHPYYTALIALVKTGKWPEKKVEIIEEKPPENEEYLHPSLASTIIESAPAIPSIHYKPSADCDYTMLISKMRGDGDDDDGETRGDVPPPGTEPPRHAAQIYRAPVMYTRGADGSHVDPTVQLPPTSNYSQQYAAYYHQYLAQEQEKQKKQHPAPLKSTGLSLMKNYNTDSDSDVSDFDDSSSTDSKEQNIPLPPDDVQIVIDKMASYVARNGDEFADIVRAKNDPRFIFLEPNNIYHPYYKRLMQQKRGGEVNGKEKKRKSTAPVSFSIKKLKEPDPILPKPALPYESSSDEDSEKHAEKLSEKQEESKDNFKVVQPYTVNNMPPVVVYKMDGQLNNDLPIVKTIESIKPAVIAKPPTKPVPVVLEVKKEVPKPPKIEEKPPIVPETPPKQEVEEVKEIVQEKKEITVDKEKESPHKKEKKKHKDRKKEYRSKSESRESRRNERRSIDKERKREKDAERESKRSKYIKDELENEVISLEDNSDDLIDLTGEQSDSKAEETEAERAKQQERRRRAAEFLKKVGVDPSAAQLPTSSLASAMVDTLESLRKKKAEEEEKRRRRDKRRHRDRRDYDDESERSHRKSKRRKHKSSDDNDESDYDGSKKKKRKRDRKHSSKSKRKRRRENEVEEEQEDPPMPVSIDLSNTLKELRTSSPTKELGLQDVNDIQLTVSRQESSDEELVRIKKKTDREYSEGEWSSDTEADSRSSPSRDG